MSSPALDAFYAEMVKHHQEVSPALEGQHEYQRLNFSAEALEEVGGEASDLERRLQLLDAAISAVSALSSDGYLDLPPEEVSKEVEAEMDLKLTALISARARFSSMPVANIAVEKAEESEPRESFSRSRRS